MYSLHWVKMVQIRSFFWSVFSCIQSEHRKIRTRKNSVFGHFSRSVQVSKILSEVIIILYSTSKQKTKTSPLLLCSLYIQIRDKNEILEFSSKYGHKSKYLQVLILELKYWMVINFHIKKTTYISQNVLNKERIICIIKNMHCITSLVLLLT